MLKQAKKLQHKEVAHNFAGVNFTKRETECMYLFIKGKTNKVVEYYLKNMRSKTKCSSKSQLIEFIIRRNPLC